jgi:hypothetical protein
MRWSRILSPSNCARKSWRRKIAFLLFVIPAQRRIQGNGGMDTGFRRYDGFYFRLQCLLNFTVAKSLHSLRTRNPKIETCNDVFHYPANRRWSTISQRSWTTLMPALAKISAAWSLRIPDGNQTDLGFFARMSSMWPVTSLGRRKTSTMSMSPGISASLR